MNNAQNTAAYTAPAANQPGPGNLAARAALRGAGFVLQVNARGFYVWTKNGYELRVTTGARNIARWDVRKAGAETAEFAVPVKNHKAAIAFACTENNPTLRRLLAVGNLIK